MQAEFTEADWKVLRQLHPVALDRLCDRILREAEGVCGDRTRSHHQRYLDLFALLQRRDKDIVQAFDRMSRSRVMERVLVIKRMGLVTDEEFARFSPGLRDWTEQLLAHAALN